MSFEYVPLKKRLTTSQENLLDSIENATSPYQGIKCLKDLRDLTGVSVIVSDKACLKKMLAAFIEEIEHRRSTLWKDISVKEIDNDQIERELNRILEKAMDGLFTVDQANVPILGLYTRKYLWFDDSNPYVILFADNIEDYARMHSTNVDNVFGYVFIHEMMHAYYDAFNAEGFPARSELEEAFAEYGMLTFIENTPSLGISLLSDAIAHVASKKKHGPHEYGFGYDLYDLTGGGDPNMMNRYRDISNWIDLDVIHHWPGAHNYFDDLFDYRRDPFNSVNSDNCLSGVNEVLDYDWKRPHTILQRAVRGGTSSSRSSRRTSHVLPPWLSRIAPHGLSPIVSSTGTGSSSSMFRASEWALSATAAESSWQFKLLQSPDKMRFIAEFVKALKRDNIEAYLSLDGRNITFLGKVLCEYSSTPGRSSHILSESLCVSGTTVYPVILQPAASKDDPLTMKQFRNLLHAASVLYDAEFTVVREASVFTLYGPDSCAASFVSPTPVVSSTSGSGRFHFEANAKYYPGTAGHSGERIVTNLPQKVYEDIDFIHDYDFHKAPFVIKITFEDSKGKRISGEATVYKGSSPAHPERMRFWIETDKGLLGWYSTVYGSVAKRFSFAEIRPGIGTSHPEWVAREI